MCCRITTAKLSIFIGIEALRVVFVRSVLLVNSVLKNTIRYRCSMRHRSSQQTAVQSVISNRKKTHKYSVTHSRNHLEWVRNSNTSSQYIILLK